jgi:hypothetical protein
MESERQEERLMTEGGQGMRWQIKSALFITLLGALMSTLCGCGPGLRAASPTPSATSVALEPFTPPADWKQIDAKGYFTFWIPSGLMEEHLQGLDSYVGSWFSPAMRVDFDYRRYSASINVQALPQPVTQMQEGSSGRLATIVTYANVSGNPVALLYVGDIDGVNHLSMTAVGHGGTEASIPLLVVHSVRFPLTT